MVLNIKFIYKMPLHHPVLVAAIAYQIFGEGKHSQNSIENKLTVHCLKTSHLY